MTMRARLLIKRLTISFGAIVIALVLLGALYDPDPAPLVLPRKVALVEGTQLAWHQTGTGPDVVLLHGGIGSAEDFEPLLPLLKSVRVTVIDRPGFGLSRVDGDAATISGNARLVGGLIRQLGLQKPILLGHSHAGGVVLKMAVEKPEAFAGLVLVAPAAWPSPNEPATLDHLSATPLLGRGVLAIAAPFVAPDIIRQILELSAGPDRSILPPDFVERRVTLWTNPRTLATSAKQNITDREDLTPLSARYNQVNVPAVVIWCTGDPFEAKTGIDSRRLSQTLPNAREVKLEGCGHYIQYSRAAEVASAVLSFTDRQGAVLP